MPPLAANDTVLIIEDDEKTAALVALYLEREGFKTVTAHDGSGGLRKAKQYQPVLVVLDLMLPGMDGWEICRQLHRFSDVPVIMLTARGDEVDRIAGLTLGADDYVVKPFSPRELVARVQAVLRRTRPTATAAPQILRIGGVTLDPLKHKVTRDGQPIQLTPHEYTLLKALMEAPGRVFSRDTLLSRLYPHHEATVIERVVDVHIGKLRQKIEAEASSPVYILTVRGVGYRFTENGR